jgi:hypothetical protein
MWLHYTYRNGKAVMRFIHEWQFKLEVTSV